MAVVVDDTTPPVVLGDDNRHGESTLFLTLLLIKNKRVNFEDPVMTTIEIKDCGNVLIENGTSRGTRKIENTWFLV